MSNCKAYSAHPALALEQLQCAELFKNQQNATQIQHRRHNSSGNLFDSTRKCFSRKISMPIMHEQHLPDVVILPQSPPQPPTHEILIDRRVRKNDYDDDDDGDDDDIEDDDNNNIDSTEGGDNYAVIDEDELITTTKDCVNCANNYNDIDYDEPDCRTNIPTTTTTTTIIKPIITTMTTSHVERIRNSQSPYRVSLNRHHLSQLQQHLALGDFDIDGGIGIVGRSDCPSGVSSTISSPSASTVSTPLSTPTRLPHTPHHFQHNQHYHNHHYHNHHQLHKCNQHCCQYNQKNNNKQQAQLQQQKQSSAFAKKLSMGGAAGTATTTTTTISPTISKSMLETKHQEHPHQEQNHHQQQHNFPHIGSSSSSSSSTSSPVNKNNNGCKKIKKFDPRLGPSPYRQLLPIALCILSFAVVFSLLIIYMDTTEIRHQQFRLNMSRDYDMFGVVQDDPQLIAFLREIHMRKYPMHFLKSRSDNGFTTTTTTTTQTSSENNNFPQQRFNFNAAHDKSDLAPLMARYVSNLVGNKLNAGSVIQSLPGSLSHLLTAPWLAETLNWAGLIVEPEPRRFFALRKQNQESADMQVLHACVSPTAYPKEVTLHNEETDVRINSLLDEETSWFNSRVKCFPLYTIMLACNRTQYDLLSLGVHGHELEILQTLPFEKVQIEVISIHLPDDHEDARNGQSSQEYIQALTQYLALKNYKMQRQFGRNYFYQRQHFISSRTRKKDILLLKTP